MIYYTVQTGIKFITWTSAIFVKTMCAKMWARKNKNRPVSGFFTKIAHVQVMNFIPVKVSTLYRVIHGFKFVCFLPLICRELTCVSSCVYWNVEFK
jgi:hypothetical protein